jgi:hypothetical protein
VRVETKPVRLGKSRERGSTLIEFTLTLLPLLGLLMLTLDLAWVIFGWASVQEAVRRGVRYAITCQSDASIKSTVQQASLGFVTNSNSGSISIHYYSPTNPSQELFGIGSNCPGNIVRVTVSGISIGPLMPIWRDGTPLQLNASLADVVEPNPVCTARF